MKRILISIFAFLVSLPIFSYAEDQVLDDQEIINVEKLYSEQPAPKAPVVESSKSSGSSINTGGSNGETSAVEKSIPDMPKQQDKLERLTDLNTLAPFREISVIQKKYLPLCCSE